MLDLSVAVQGEAVRRGRRSWAFTRTSDLAKEPAQLEVATSRRIHVSGFSCVTPTWSQGDLCWEIEPTEKNSFHSMAAV